MNQEIKVPTMLTIKETAKVTGIAEYNIRQLVAGNKICFVKAGRKYLINLEKFIEYLNTPQKAWCKYNELYIQISALQIRQKRIALDRIGHEKTIQNNADIWVYNSYNKIGQNNKAKKTIAYYITLIPLTSTL